MNFRQLEYIRMIEKEGSVSKAAAKLFISQSALSQQLLKLEEEIGAPIFERGFSPLRPTDFGAEYLQYVERILFDYEQANRLLEEMEHKKRSRLTIGIPVNRSTQLLPDFIPKFIHDFPNIELTFLEHPAYRLDEMLLAGDIDFSLMTSHSGSPNIISIPVLQEEIFLACQKDCELDRRLRDKGTDFADLKDFADEPFILMKKGHRLHNLTRQLFEQYEIQPKVILETGNVDLTRRLAAGGAGVCFSSSLPRELNPFTPEPSYYSIGPKGVFWELCISYHKDKYISWAMRLFFDQVRQSLKNHFPELVIEDMET